MDCLSPNCTITANDRMISCWLCLGNFHLKCTALKSRDADALLDTAKSLHWTCVNCKKINIEFYKFFKSQKSEFEQLNKEFLSVQSKLAKFEDLFNNFQSLDKFINLDCNNSPKTKKKTNKLSEIPSINTVSVPSSANSVTVNAGTSTSSTSLNVASSHQLNNPSIDMDNGVPVSTASPIITEPINGIIDNQTVHRPLQAVPPRKNIFVSRLAWDTTSEDVDYYIRSKLGRNIDIFIQKFSFTTSRSISSFKISISHDYFNVIMDPHFWPANTLVREYVYREKIITNRIGVLPRQEQNISKN